MMIFLGSAMDCTPCDFRADYDLHITHAQAPCLDLVLIAHSYHIHADGCCSCGSVNSTLAEPKSLDCKDEDMNRLPPFASPLMLGFDAMENTLKRIAKGNDGYPPYNIERVRQDETSGEPERLRITLAVAGFSEDDLDVTSENNQLVIRGRQIDSIERDYLHRGIAARQFQRTFMLADGLMVLKAELRNGLLSIDLVRPEPVRMVKKINIFVPD
jgi:HSP20 family molecular chaperone IbpA